MSESINEWVDRAKANEATSGAVAKPVQVVRNEAPKNRSALIMAVAEALRPHLTKLFDGVRDEEDKLIQPAHVRGYALNMAQHIVHTHEQNNAA